MGGRKKRAMGWQKRAGVFSFKNKIEATSSLKRAEKEFEEGCHTGHKVNLCQEGK